LQQALRLLYEEGGPNLWDEIEEMVMRTAYTHARQNQLRAARLLGVSRNVVRARLLQFGALTRSARGLEGPESTGRGDDEDADAKDDHEPEVQVQIQSPARLMVLPAGHPPSTMAGLAPAEHAI
jgi:Zn-dependent peptidase ImmA (M78 family)